MDLGFSGHELQKNPSQPGGFLGQVTATLVNTKQVVPADSKGGVNRLQHSIKPLRQIAPFWNFKRNGVVANLRLRTEQPLAHGFGLDEEGLSNASGIQAKDRLQHERSMHNGIYRWMCAHEKQLESFVWKCCRKTWFHEGFLKENKRRLCPSNHAPVTNNIDQ